MEFMDVVRARHSVRCFRPEPVEQRLIEEIIEAASLAPSAMNAQPWSFHVATGATRNRVLEVMSQTTVYLNEFLEVLGPERIEQAARFWTELGDAPVIVAVTMPKSDDELARLNNCISVGAAIQNFLLAATDKGLGACNITFSFWVRGELAETLRVPEDRSIASLLLLGHPAAVPEAQPRRTGLAVFLD